ncbi:hypothetical protein ACLOJK_018242 [Asimina triloba]
MGMCQLNDCRPCPPARHEFPCGQWAKVFVELVRATKSTSATQQIALDNQHPDCYAGKDLYGKVIHLLPGIATSKNISRWGIHRKNMVCVASPRRSLLEGKNL